MCACPPAHVPGYAHRAQGRERARRERHIAAGGPAGRLRRADPRLVHRCVRRADPGPGAGLGGDRRAARTRWSSRPPGRARRWPRSCGRSTGSPASPAPADPKLRCRVLYISPLKALAVDIERNLRSPLAGIRPRGAAPGPARARHPGRRCAPGTRPPTSAAQLASKPPDILITTPESLFLLLTSRAREALRGVDTVIVDEVHALAGQQARRAPGAVAGTAGRAAGRRRATSPAAGPAGPAQRIGLSATVRPAEEVAAFLGGARPVTIAAPPSEQADRAQIVVPVEDMTDLDRRRVHRLGPTACRATWSARGTDGRPTSRRPRPALDLAARGGAGARPDRGSTGPRSCSPTPAGWPSGSAAGSTSSPPSAPRRRRAAEEGMPPPAPRPPPYRRRSWPRPAPRRARRPRSPGPTTARCPGRSGRRSRRR